MGRLTHERSNGIRTGYWSPAKKEELVAKLAEYEDLEERGLLLRMPCKIGDKIYIPMYDPPEDPAYYIGIDTVADVSANTVQVGKDEWIDIKKELLDPEYPAYLHREDAEKELERMRKENGD